MASSEVPAAGQVYFSDSEVQGSTGRSVGYGKDYGDSDLASTSAGSTDAEDLRQFQPIDILKSDCPEPCRQQCSVLCAPRPPVLLEFADLTVEAKVAIRPKTTPDVLSSAWTAAQATNMRVLHSMSGRLEPGTLNLLLGAPGSGKTTLLSLLAGCKYGSNIEISGKVAYNGEAVTSVDAPSLLRFMGDTIHIGEMSCREVLTFAQQCRPGANLTSDEIRAEVDALLEALGLIECADTPVGSPLVRGISGGQKHRLSLGEALVGGQSVLLLDDVGQGLDSSTALQIVRVLQSLAADTGATILSSMMHPGLELMQHFHSLIILAEGHLVYSGPVVETQRFFQRLGFTCPYTTDLSVFLEEVTSVPGQERFWTDLEKYECLPPRKIAEAFQSWRGPVGQPAAQLAKQDTAAVLLKGSGSRPPGWRSFKVCLWREAILAHKTMLLEAARLGHTLAMSLLAGTLFLKSRVQSQDIIGQATLYLGLAFFSLMNVLFDGVPEMTLTMQRMPVIRRQYEEGYYQAWAVLLPSILFRVPYSVAKALLFAAVVALLSGIVSDIGRFFCYALVMFALHNAGFAIVRVIGSVRGSDMVLASVASALFLLITILGGFILAKDSIPVWWRWANWISPLTYAWNCMCNTVFSSSKWQQVYAMGETVEQLVLGQRQTPLGGEWQSVGIVAVIGVTILCYLAAWVVQCRKSTVPWKSQTLTKEEAQAAGIGAEAAPSAKSAPAACIEQPVESSSWPAIEGKGDATLLMRPGSSGSGSSTGFAISAIHGAADQGDVGGSQPPPANNSGASAASIMKTWNLGSAEKSVLPVQPTSLAFQNVCYFVPNPMAGKKAAPLQLLDGLSGCFQPGLFWALMGVSGAGKTTMLDVLAGRKRSKGGNLTGNIWVGRRPKNQTAFLRVSGYVQQQEVLCSYTTVAETLAFSAKLRLPKGTPPVIIASVVQEALELVELQGLEHRLVGDVIGGLTAACRKRVAIAVELVANPAILLLDEPTTGLDAHAAGVVLRAVQRTCHTDRRTVVCTIHQPSMTHFQMFDCLMLMIPGGRIAYNGPLGLGVVSLIRFFYGIPGIAPYTLDSNPATWALNCTSREEEQRLHMSFSAHYLASASFRQLEQDLDQVAAADCMPLGDSEAAEPRPGPMSQLPLLLARNFRSYKRHIGYAGVRLLATGGISLLLGSIYWGTAHRRSTSQDIANVLGALYLSTTFIGVMTSLSVQPFVATERLVFYREQAAGYMTVLPFALSQAIVELPFLVAQNCLYSFILFWMFGFVTTPGNLAYFFCINQLMLICVCYYGLMCVYLTPHVGLASIVGNLFYSMWHLLSGFLIAPPHMPPYYAWTKYANPLAWTLDGLITSEYGSDAAVLRTLSFGDLPIAEFIHRQYGYRHDWLPWIPLIIASFCVCFVVAAGLSLKLLAFNRS